MDLRGLDCLRGFLAVYVLAGHARWLLWSGHAAWLKNSPAGSDLVLGYASAMLRFGHEAVMVFFMLSGFFIHLRVAQQLAQDGCFTFRAVEYGRRRLHRFVPPYAFALALTLLADGIGQILWPTLYAGRTGDALLDGTFQGAGFGWSAVVPALFLLPSAQGASFGSNGPLWSIAYEAVYYATYPLWLALRRVTWVGSYAAGLGLGLLPGFAPVSGFPSLVLAHYPLWLAGAALAEITCNRTVGRGFLAAGIALAGAGVTAFGFEAGKLGARMALAMGLILVSGTGLRQFLGARGFRILEWLGMRSYTIYVCHFPLLVLAAAAWIHAEGTRPLSGWLALMGAGLALGLSVLCFEVWERRFLHSRIRLA